MPKLQRGAFITAGLSAVLAAFVYLLAFHYVPLDSAEFPPPDAADNLPTRLNDEEFWRMISDFSEAGGFFRSDNFLSNEGTYQYVIPSVKKKVRAGGVYMGVGPEQNFTYVAAFEPKMAFIVDIRRQNMIEHLLYKSLMELSANRGEFLSRLFSRPPVAVGPDESPEALYRVYQAAEPDTALFNRNVRQVWEHLTGTHHFDLSAEDEKSLRYVYNAFFEAGPDMSYMFLPPSGGGWGMPTYGELMTETDGLGRNWSFLATDEQFRRVQQMERDNLIIPLVGDFAGDKAIRAVARYLREHGATLSAFYTSNVEQYLFQQGDEWKSFYSNVATLPLDSSSTFIRFVLNGRGFGFRQRSFESRSSSLTCSIRDVIKAFNSGKIRSYYDVTEMSK